MEKSKKDEKPKELNFCPKCSTMKYADEGKYCARCSKGQCKHKNLFFGRLLKGIPEEEKEKIKFVIETICADCGLFIKKVDVTYN